MSAIAGVGPLLQLTRRGAVWHGTEAAQGVSRDEFSRRHVIKLPALLDGQLLRQIHIAIDRSQFRELVHPGIASELCMATNACLGLLHFLVNDRHMYRLVEDVSGCRPISFFSGRVYRRLPNSTHHDSWHSDLVEGRQIGMSLNLSAQPYEGGLFEIREAAAERQLAAIANIGPGDALLFRIDPALEHRVTNVRGAVPKTAFAGWFGSSRDYLAALREDPFLTAEES